MFTSSPLNDVSHPIHDVMRLNNEGIAATLANEDEKAISSFSTALSMLKKLIFVTPVEEEVANRSTILHRSIHPLSSLQSQESYFLYNGLLKLQLPSTTAQDAQLPTAADCHVYCSAIILNLAISFHSIGSIEKAERFYGMILKILGDSDCNEGTEVLVKLAALNNLSEIQLSKGEQTSSEELLRRLTWIVSSSQVETKSSVLNEDVVEGMILNALIVNNQTVAPAA